MQFWEFFESEDLLIYLFALEERSALDPKDGELYLDLFLRLRRYENRVAYSGSPASVLEYELQFCFFSSMDRACTELAYRAL